jgi:hypothetical protein
MQRIRKLALVKLLSLLLFCFGIPISGAQPLLDQPDVKGNPLRSGEVLEYSDDFHPLQYRKKITDGGYKGSVVVDFDQVNQVARIVKDRKRSELRIPKGIQDELSMIYLLRTKEIEVGERYEFPALVGTRALNASIAVLRTEELRTALGTLKTIVVKAIPRDITMWLTNDAARIPVRMEASTKIGKLVFNLTKMR